MSPFAEHWGGESRTIADSIPRITNITGVTAAC